MDCSYKAFIEGVLPIILSQAGVNRAGEVYFCRRGVLCRISSYGIGHAAADWQRWAAKVIWENDIAIRAPRFVEKSPSPNGVLLGDVTEGDLPTFFEQQLDSYRYFAANTHAANVQGDRIVLYMNHTPQVT